LPGIPLAILFPSVQFTLDCPTTKSSRINNYRDDTEGAVFIDDTDKELNDVNNNSDNVTAIHTAKTGTLTLKKAA